MAFADSIRPYDDYMLFNPRDYSKFRLKAIIMINHLCDLKRYTNCYAILLIEQPHCTVTIQNFLDNAINVDTHTHTHIYT
jgi:hypothetical protein